MVDADDRGENIYIRWFRLVDGGGGRPFKSLLETQFISQYQLFAHRISSQKTPMSRLTFSGCCFLSMTDTL